MSSIGGKMPQDRGKADRAGVRRAGFTDNPDAYPSWLFAHGAVDAAQPGT
jgi:hypothetical protein